jgi:ribosomal protein S18 acetylase RimI-like enzyme
MRTIVHEPTRMPTLAAVPGIRFRHFRGLDADIPGMAAANQASRTADGEVEPIDVEGMRVAYTHNQNCDPDRDICVVESHGEIAGYSRVFWDDLILEDIREYFAISLLRPDVRLPEVRRALFAWSEERRRGIAAEHRAAGDVVDRPLWLGSGSPDNDLETVELLRASGYEPNRRFASLVRPDLESIVETPLPDGLTTRPIVRDEHLLRRIWEAESEAFRDHFGAREPTEDDYAAFLEEPGQDLALWYIAFDGDDIAAGVRCNIKVTADGIREGWLDPVFTRRAWRRRGVARALIGRSLVGLRRHGADRAALGVDLQNPNQALRLYESNGFRVVSSSTDWRKPLVLDGEPDAEAEAGDASARPPGDESASLSANAR